MRHPIDLADKTWQKVAVWVAAVVVFLAISVIVDKVMAAPIEEQWKPSSTYSLPFHNITIWQTNRYGDVVPRTVRGHLLCPPTTYLTQSKYTGVACASKSTELHARKAVIKCGAQVAAGWYFGKTTALKAAVVGCIIEWSL